MRRKCCPGCGSLKLHKFGLKWSGHKKVQQYQCGDCGRITIHPKEAAKV